MCENLENFNLEPEKAGDTPEQRVPPEGFIPFFESEFYQKYKEKKEIKRLSNAIGISGILLFVFSFLISMAFSLVILVLFGQKGMEISEDPAILQAIQIVFSCFSFTVPFIIIYKAFGYRIGDLMSFGKSKKGTVLPLICFGLAVCSFANFGASYVDSIFRHFGITYDVPDFDYPDGVLGFILVAIATAVVPALVEEFALRGLVLGSLRKFGDVFALITSSAIFGIMHGNFEQIPFAFTVGLFLGFTVIKTGSLRVAIFIHFINNMGAVVFSYFPDTVPEVFVNVIYVIYLLSCLVLGLISLKNEQGDTALLKIADKECESTLRERCKFFFTSVGFIIFAVISLLQAVIYFFI